MRAELGAFFAGAPYPSADTDIESLLHAAVILRRCDLIDQLIPRLVKPIQRPCDILFSVGSKKLLPVLTNLLNACELGPYADEYTIFALTKDWLLPYTFPLLKATFSDLQLTRSCRLGALDSLKANGVRLSTFEFARSLSAGSLDISRALVLQLVEPLDGHEREAMKGTPAYDLLFRRER